jgi:hypothetical protein
MEKNLMRWLKIGVVLEVLICSVIALLVLFDLMGGEAAQSAAIKITVGVVVLTIAGAVIGAVLGKADVEAPKA